MLIFFGIQDKLTRGGIRAEEADEIVGMDMPEMGVFAYPQFLPAEEAAIDLVSSPRRVSPVTNS